MRWLLAGMLIVFWSAAFADREFSGNTLLRMCEARDAYCSGYIHGVVETLKLHSDFNAALKDEKPTICIPGSATVGQMVDVVKMYLIEKPSIRHMHAQIHIGNAVTQAWPCPK